MTAETSWKERSRWFVRVGRRNRSRIVDPELRAQVADDFIFLGRGDGRPPADHFVDLTRPANPREPLFADDVGAVARETPRRRGLPSWSIGKVPGRRGCGRAPTCRGPHHEDATADDNQYS